MVLLPPFLAVGSKSTSFSGGIHMWVQAVQYDLFSSGIFLPYFNILTLSLTLLVLCSKSTTLSLGFSLHRPSQYNTICWESNLIPGIFAFFWLIVWADGINKYGWCVAGGRGSWLKGLHQIPRVSFIIPHSTTFIRLSYLYQGFYVHCIAIINNGGWDRWWGHELGNAL